MVFALAWNNIVSNESQYTPQFRYLLGYAVDDHQISPTAMHVWVTRVVAENNYAFVGAVPVIDNNNTVVSPVGRFDVRPITTIFRDDKYTDDDQAKLRAEMLGLSLAVTRSLEETRGQYPALKEDCLLRLGGYHKATRRITKAF
jgi:hypothetical protein